MLLLFAAAVELDNKEEVWVSCMSPGHARSIPGQMKGRIHYAHSDILHVRRNCSNENHGRYICRSDGYPISASLPVQASAGSCGSCTDSLVVHVVYGVVLSNRDHRGPCGSWEAILAACRSGPPFGGFK